MCDRASTLLEVTFPQVNRLVGKINISAIQLLVFYQLWLNFVVIIMHIFT
jgi:hypothetical protein